MVRSSARSKERAKLERQLSANGKRIMDRLDKEKLLMGQKHVDGDSCLMNYR